MDGRTRRRKHAGEKSPAPKHGKRTKEKQHTGTSWVILIPLLVIAFTTFTAFVGYFRAVIEPVAYSSPRVELKGPLEVNTVLADGEQLLVGNVGPESIEFDAEGNLYTGFVDGRIVKVHPSATGEVAEGLVEEFSSGPIKGVKPIDGWKGPARPLGLRLHGGKLYVIDAYYGLYSIDLKSKDVQVLVPPDGVSPPMKFPNDLAITKDGKTIYFTDTSDRWNLALLTYDVAEGLCRGRVFKLDIASGKTETLRDGICFANGIQLSPDESTLVVSETSRYRVLFIDARTGKTTKTVAVPGMPDNVRASSTGGYWVATPIVRTWLSDTMEGLPLVRKILSGLLPPHILVKSGKTGSGLGVELDKDGNIVGSVHDQDGKTSRAVSEVAETTSGVLLAGSYKSPFLVKTRRGR